MSEDFNINRFPWYNTTGILRTCRHLDQDAKDAGFFVRNLTGQPFDVSINEAIEEAAQKLLDAHLSVKVALAEYRKGAFREAAE